MPGEHDASLDKGEAFKEFFGATHYTFDHKGVHFIALDNVSDPAAKLGDEQLAWLAADLKQRKPDDRIVVLTHRPLFDLKPNWDWTTADGAKAIELLMPYQNVVVFYGHIHQENHHMTGHIAHHAAKSLIFPLPAPGSQPKRAPLPYDAAMPGLGTRDVAIARQGQPRRAAGHQGLKPCAQSVRRAADGQRGWGSRAPLPAENPNEISVVAMKFNFTPERSRRSSASR